MTAFANIILLPRPLSNDSRFNQFICRYSHASKRFVETYLRPKFNTRPRIVMLSLLLLLTRGNSDSTQCLPEVVRWQRSFVFQVLPWGQRSRSNYLKSGCMACNANRFHVLMFLAHALPGVLVQP